MVLADDRTYDYNTPVEHKFEEPIEYRAGDEIRVTCQYNSLNKTKVTTYGEGTQDEMCFGFITVYPAVKGFDNCFQWKDLPMCSINNFDVYSGCNLTNFSTSLGNISQVCTSACSKVCHNAISSLNATGCWEGSLQEYIKQFWPIFVNANLSKVFSVIDYCSNVTSEQSTIKNSTEKLPPMFTELPMLNYSNSVTHGSMNPASQLQTGTASPKPEKTNATTVPSTTMNFSQKHPPMTSELSALNPSESVPPGHMDVTSQLKSETVSPKPGFSNPTHQQQMSTQQPNNTAVPLTGFWKSKAYIFAGGAMFFVLKI